MSVSSYRLKDFQELFPETPLKEFDGKALTTLREWEVLAAKCSCGHFGIVNAALLLKHRSNQYLMHLEPKLRCYGCKQRGTSKFWIGKLPR